MNATISDRVIEQLKVLPQDLQWRVLEFARALAVSTPKGTPGSEVAKLAGGITPEDAELMRTVIQPLEPLIPVDPQQVVISVYARESNSPEETLAGWAQVCAGLSDDEIQEVESVALARK